MKAELSQELLQSVTANIIEEAAFIFMEVVDPPPPFEGEVVEAVVDFAGSVKGKLRLAAAPELGTGLAANLLGIDPSDPEVAEKGSDALGETLNIIGGAILAALFDPHEGPRLGIPRVSLIPVLSYDQRRMEFSIQVSFCTEEGFRLDADAAIESAP